VELVLHRPREVLIDMADLIAGWKLVPRVEEVRHELDEAQGD
jgi:hypothetical protein